MNQKNSYTQLPDYLASAKPNPAGNRAPWSKNTAPTYAGIFLWFVFWQDVPASAGAGGNLAYGLGSAIVALVISALVCHLFFYLVPGLFGMKTGMPLYIVGSSTFGAKGGFMMPGFLMGVLQFGWLAVNIYFSAMALSAMLGAGMAKPLMIIWGVLAAFMGLKGIQYVAKIATYLPLIPLIILIVLFLKTVGGIGGFDGAALAADQQSTVADIAPKMTAFGMVAFMLTYVVGFFATAGAAGVDFGTNSRDERDVHMGGLVGIGAAIAFTGILAILIVGGIYGNPETAVKAKEAGFSLNPVNLMSVVVGETGDKWFKFLLAIAAFPAACFSSFIAANSFKTTLPKVNPFVSVGIGAAVAILLALTGVAANAVGVFVVIGASFGPICGAMMVDYCMAGNKWAGPRAGFNTAGWLSWGLGFLVGIMPNMGIALPAAPVVAFIVGAVVYYICAKLGMESEVLPMPSAKAEVKAK